MTTLSEVDFSNYLARCTWPSPTIADVAAWGEIDFGTGATAVAKVGLFGYDVSCLFEVCYSALDEYNYCGQLGGVDGLSFGIHTEIVKADSDGSLYCVGFPDTEFGATAACVKEYVSGSYTFATLKPVQGYEITDTVFAAEI